MNKTTKLLSTIVLAAIVLAACLTLVACNDKVNNYFVTYDGNTITVSGKKGEAVSFPKAERDGYLFDGWYMSENFDGNAVDSAVFGEETTYYAKWAEACTVTLQPEGGVLDATTVVIKKGANILQSLADYTPVKGSLQFGGWFEGDRQVSANDTADKGSLTLSARYKAAYTVNVYLQRAEGDEYDYTEKYAEGYAFVEEDFFPDITIEGFTILADDVDDIMISEDSSKNVFNLHFSRNTYEVAVYESYPLGGAATLVGQQTYRYGATDFLPDTEYTYEGYLMLGWATRQGATYTDLIGDDYVLNSNISLYPLWEAGYTDMFSGEDYIFLKHDADNSAILLRGGIQIKGAYDSRYDMYIFESPVADGIKVRAKIDGEHFIYYANRANSYKLVEGLNTLNDDVTLYLDNENGARYYDSKNGITKSGTYTIDETGLYIATFEPTEEGGEKTSFAFIIGTLRGTPAFRIRGDESQYGEIDRRAAYYPRMTFNGFGTVLVTVQDQSATYTYTVGQSTDNNGKKVVFYNISTGQSTLCVKVNDYNGTFGYDYYEPDYDRDYGKQDETGTILTLDGCAKAVYKSVDGETFEGEYTAVQSIRYDVINNSQKFRTIVTVKGNNETRVYILYVDYLRNPAGEPVGLIPVHWFEEVGAGYTERQLVDDNGYLTDSYLIADGNGRAATWEYIDKVLTKTTEGTYEANVDDYSYLYTPDDTTNAVAFKYKTMTLAYSNYNSYSLCFALGYTDADGAETDLFERFRTKGAQSGAELYKNSTFGIYIDGDGKVLVGLVRKMTNYWVLTDGQDELYLSFDNDDHERFYVLEQAPLVMYKRVDGKTDANSTLTVSWKDLGDGKYEATYIVKDGDNATTIEGYYTQEKLFFPGTYAYLYTFTSDDGETKFKFTFTQSGSRYIFDYYEIDSVIEFVDYTELRDDNSTDSKNKITLTDERYEGKLVIAYFDGTNTIKGTFDTYTETSDGETVVSVGKQENAFFSDKYSAIVYTFTSIDGATTVRFTLNNGYFRICADNKTYTDANGATLELDGATHIARYTDKDGNESFSYYIVTDGVLTDGKAIYMLINDSKAYLDLNGDKFALRGEESGKRNLFKNGVPYGKTIEFDGQGKAIVYDIEDGSEVNPKNVTYTFNGSEYTVFDEENKVLYVGKLTIVSLSGRSYPAYSIVMDNIAGSYINQKDLSVVVLDNAGGAVRYDSYGTRDDGYYFRIDDKLFYFIDSTSSFAALYTINGNEIVDTGVNVTYYSSDFASIVFYKTGTVLINNAESMYYVANDDGTYTTYKAADNVDDPNANAYGYIKGKLEEKDVGEGDNLQSAIEFEFDGNARTYFRFDTLDITLADNEHGYTLTFQPDGGATFTVEGTLTIAATEEGKEDKTVKYYVCLDYDNDGNPYLFLADRVADYVNGGSQYSFVRNYNIGYDFADRTFSFTTDEYKLGLTAYNFMYVYYLNYFGSSAASMLSSLNGALNIIRTTTAEGDVYTLSGVFNYIKASDGQSSFSFANGTLSRAGYSDSRYGHAYTSEFEAEGERYHLTFFLMPPNTADGMYVYRIYTLTKVTCEVVIDAENNTKLYNEELVYTEFNIATGEVDKDGNDILYKVNEAFRPSLRYKGELLVGFPVGHDGDTWTFYDYVFENGSLKSEIKYDFTPTYDEDGNINGGSIVISVGLVVETANGDMIFVWCKDGENTVKEIANILFKGDETATAPTKCEKNADGESFTVTAKGVTYIVEFTFTTDEEGNTTVTATITEQAQSGESTEQTLAA